MNWQPMDSAPRDGTVINVVARIPIATAGFPQYASWRSDVGGGGWYVSSYYQAPVKVFPWAWRMRDDWPMPNSAGFPEDHA